MDRKQSSIGSYPSHWDLVSLETVAELKHGYQFRTHDFTSEGVKIFKITQIKSNGQIDISCCDFIEKGRLDDFKKFIIKKGDILMALSGATIGKIARFNSNEIVLQNYRVGNFLPLDETKLSKDYFYYFLTTDITFQQILANQTQSAQENVGKEDIHKMLLFFPPFQEQIAIASVLDILDKKIELLHRQNETLEKIGEIIFRQWFLVNVQDEWQEIPLSEIADHVKETISPSKSPQKFYKHYSLPAFDAGKVPVIELGKEILSNKYKVITNSILVSKLNPRTPRIWMILDNVNEDEAICSSEFQIVKPKNIKWYGFIYWFLKSNQVTQELAGASSGTSGSHQRINPQDIFNLTLQKPSQNIIDSFYEITQPYLNKISNNEIQITTLINLRNTLLPKLINGEVTVEQ